MKDKSAVPPSKPKQLDFLSKLNFADDSDMLRVTVIHDGTCYVATIQGGWWSATGATPKDAVKSCVRLYENDMERYE